MHHSLEAFKAFARLIIKISTCKTAKTSSRSCEIALNSGESRLCSKRTFQASRTLHFDYSRHQTRDRLHSTHLFENSVHTPSKHISFAPAAASTSLLTYHVHTTPQYIPPDSPHPYSQSHDHTAQLWTTHLSTAKTSQTSHSAPSVRNPVHLSSNTRISPHF